MNMKLFLAILALLAPAAASAAVGVTLESQVFVERTTADAAGKPKTVLEPPKVVTPGDKLLFVISYRNGGAEPATGFVLTNPMPQAVAYAGSDASGADVSVDGGKNWGALAALRIANPDGTSRPAAQADVTHIRWRFSQAIPAGQGGKLSFRGTVR
jgi:uncharacterized repeat protein (TIGR01451 family)